MAAEQAWSVPRARPDTDLDGREIAPRPTTEHDDRNLAARAAPEESKAVASVTMERLARAPEAVAGRLVGRPHTRSAETARVVRRALGRHTCRLGHCQGGRWHAAALRQPAKRLELVVVLGMKPTEAKQPVAHL